MIGDFATTLLKDGTTADALADATPRVVTGLRGFVVATVLVATFMLTFAATAAFERMALFRLTSVCRHANTDAAPNWAGGYHRS